MPGAHARHTQLAWLDMTILLICQIISVNDDWPILWGNKKRTCRDRALMHVPHADREKKDKWEDRLSARCATRIMIEIM